MTYRDVTQAQETKCPIHGWNLRSPARRSPAVDCERCGFEARNIEDWNGGRVRFWGIAYFICGQRYETRETWERLSERLKTEWWDT